MTSAPTVHTVVKVGGGLLGQAGAFDRAIAALGKTVGAPWGADQKAAALAAAVALYADQK